MQQYRSHTLNVENYDITRTILLSLILKDSLTKCGKLRYWKMPFELILHSTTQGFKIMKKTPLEYVDKLPIM